jgi:hypothetical protein
MAKYSNKAEYHAIGNKVATTLTQIQTSAMALKGRKAIARKIRKTPQINKRSQL